MSWSQPHDAYVKATFADVANAGPELRAALPRALADLTDWDTLRLELGSFVDAALAARVTDLLFSVRLAGRDARIYLLFEHQSTEDVLMPFRVLAYQVRIWEAWLKHNQSAKRLPPIVAVVLAQVEGRWEAPTKLIEVIDFGSDAERAALAPFVPRFSFCVDDLGRLTEAKLAGRAMPPPAKLALAALRSLRSVRLSDASLHRRLAPWIREVPATKAGTESLRSLVQYVWWVRPHLSDDWLNRMVAEAPGGAENVVMTTLRQGIEQGEARGEARGEAQGARRALATTLVKLLTLRFTTVSDEDRAKIAAADLTTLERWIDRVLTAETVASVLAD